MKVLHINTSTTGGASLCAIRINKSLSNEGIDSRMLFAEGQVVPDGITGAIAARDAVFWNKKRLLKKIRNQIAKVPGYMDTEKMQHLLNVANNDQLYLHIPLSYYKNIAHHPFVEWADIIHLHWVSDFIDYPTFFKKVQKPIVWTLHDKFPTEGVQHYNSVFYPIPDSLKEIDSYCRKIKRDSICKAKSLNIVAISEMMVEICRNSDVLKGFPVTLIHNGVEIGKYQSHRKQDSRKELGIISDATVFLFVSYNINDNNKGLKRIINSLENVDIPNKLLVCIGGFSNIPLPDSSFPIILTGVVSNHEKMAKYYSSADYFLHCSLEETFAQTPLEAMACGTPVISTPCSGASDIIKDFNGVICDGFDNNSIADGIMKASLIHYDKNVIRQYIDDNFNYQIIAKQYIELYESIL